MQGCKAQSGHGVRAGGLCLPRGPVVAIFIVEKTQASWQVQVGGSPLHLVTVQLGMLFHPCTEHRKPAGLSGGLDFGLMSHSGIVIVPTFGFRSFCTCAALLVPLVLSTWQPCLSRTAVLFCSLLALGAGLRESAWRGHIAETPRVFLKQERSGLAPLHVSDPQSSLSTCLHIIHRWSAVLCWVLRARPPAQEATRISS